MGMEGVPAGKRGRGLEGEVEWFGRGVRAEDGMRGDPKGALAEGGQYTKGRDSPTGATYLLVKLCNEVGEAFPRLQSVDVDVEGNLGVCWPQEVCGDV
jgi:hypothetical protein